LYENIFNFNVVGYFNCVMLYIFTSFQILFHKIYILFLDDFIQPNSEESTRGNVFQQSTTLTAKMWPPVSYKFNYC